MFLTAANRCLHFRYFFASNDEEAGDSEISVHYRGSSANKWTHLQSFKGSEFASWTYEFASLDIPPVDGLQVSYAAMISCLESVLFVRTVGNRSHLKFSVIYTIRRRLPYNDIG